MYKLRFRAGGSTDVCVNPAQLLGNSGIDPWGVALGTAKSPGHDSNERVVAPSLPRHQRAPTVSLAAVLPGRGGTEHGLADVPRPVGRAAPGALTVALGLNINLLQFAGLAAPGAEGAPARHGGRHGVVVGGGGGQAGRHHGAGEGDWLGELHDGKVVVGGALVVVGVGDPLAGSHQLLPVRPGDVVLAQAHPEPAQVGLAVGSCQDGVGAEESSPTERPGARGANQSNLPGELVLPRGGAAHYLGVGGRVHPTPAVALHRGRAWGWGWRRGRGRGRGQTGTGQGCARQQD